MARLLIYTHTWPLFITVMPHAIDLRDIDVYVQEVDALYKRRERFATLVDTSAVSSLPGAHERKRLADWQNATVDQIRRYNVFTATVVRSSVMRGAMTAMNWIFRPPNEQVAVASFEDGFSQCLDKLRADGAKLPDSLRRLAAGRPPRSVDDTLGDQRDSLGSA